MSIAPLPALPELGPDERRAHGSAAEYAYTILRQQILSGGLRPGHRLREVELTDWLGVSRTPTRQALSRLETEGLIAVEPKVGMVVASLSEEAMEELYDMRGVLEAAAAAMAARQASAREIATLQEMVALEATLPTDGETRYRHNLDFHAVIYRAAHNRFLMKSLHALNDAIALLGPTTMSASGRVDLAQSEHAAIVEAIEAHDADRAALLAREHVLTALQLRRKMRNPDSAA
ncbi:GntR family transcriptional regulator [Paracoccus sp. (in: a-proteobacteria)]|uniref:GntR family transcriptional regulator n=1 Tax=Paracoccus sp. TaxID=267 RepID=UPI002AFEB9DF|nr:GntR family transcriptional regulator [Paracoccus sp. (in: a-proteobacteria)]